MNEQHLYSVTPDNAPDPDSFERFNDQAAVDAEFAAMFGLEETPAAIIELGQSALVGSLAEGTYADIMNAQAEAAGIAPLTDENIEHEVAELYAGFAFNQQLIAAEQAARHDDELARKRKERKKKRSSFGPDEEYSQVA